MRAMHSVGLLIILGTFLVIATPDPPPGQPLHSTAPWPPVIILDPGHGGNDNGARANGIKEKLLTLDLALRVEKLLQKNSLTVILTRRSDRYVSLAERAKLANSHPHGVFVSIHANQFHDSSVGGVQSFYTSRKLEPQWTWTWTGFFNPPAVAPPDDSEELAAYLQTSLTDQLGEPNRGIKKQDFYVIRKVYSDAALVEVGFISNPMEAQLFKNIDYRNRTARAIAEGIEEFVLSKKPPKSQKNKQQFARRKGVGFDAQKTKVQVR